LLSARIADEKLFIGYSTFIQVYHDITVMSRINYLDFSVVLW